METFMIFAIVIILMVTLTIVLGAIQGHLSTNKEMEEMKEEVESLKEEMKEVEEELGLIEEELEEEVIDTEIEEENTEVLGVSEDTMNLIGKELKPTFKEVLEEKTKKEKKKKKKKKTKKIKIEIVVK